MLKKLCLATVVFILLGGLSGCIPAAFVVGSGASSAIVASDKRGMRTMVQDRDMANEALKRISANPELRKHTHIIIAGFNHVMLMVGQAATEDLRNQAYDAVKVVPNIKRIYNEVTIEPSTSRMVQTKDSWITTKVRSAMLMQKGLHSGQFKVVTENKVVYLMGLVTPRQADLAAQAASEVAGVQKVIKLFEYEL